MVRFVTALFIVICLPLLAVVFPVAWILATYAPLWLQIAGSVVTAWLLVIAVLTLLERGTFDRWLLDADQWVRLGDIKCTDPKCPCRRKGQEHVHLNGSIPAGLLRVGDRIKIGGDAEILERMS